MLKKTLLAAAISAVTLNASAAVIAITGTAASLEGSVGAASVAVPTAVVTVGSEYSTGDTVTFTFSGATVDTTNSAPVLAGALLGSDGAAGGAGDAVDDTVTFGLLSTSASAITFRITNQTDGGTDGVTYTDALGGAYADGTFTLTGVVLTTSSVTDAAGDVNVVYSALTSNNQAIDTAGTLTDVAVTSTEQFTSTTTTLGDAVIDVNNDREQFTVGPLTDTIVITPVEAVAAVNDATYTGITHVLKGDFTWMESDGDAGIDAAELATAFAATGAGDDTFVSTINTAGTEITVVATDGGANAVEAHTFTFTVLGTAVETAPVLPTQTFTVDSTIAYTNVSGATTKSVSADEAAGAWTLNGANFTIPYMPFGPNTNPILTVTHTGAEEGELFVEYMKEGATEFTTLDMNGMMIQPGITNMKADIMDAIVAEILADSGETSGKVAVEITINSPDEQISAYAAFKVKTDAGEESRVKVGTFGALGDRSSGTITVTAGNGTGTIN